MRLLSSAGWMFFVLAVAWFYAWAPASFPVRWLNAQPVGLYHELADAFLDGHLYLQRQPDPHLTVLPDPYDPAQNKPWRVNDVSYYGGRYYLYHGPAPALTLFAPVKLLTGRYLTDAGAVFLFCLGGFITSLAVLLALKRNHLPRCPDLVVVCSASMLALGDGYQAVLRDPTINQVAIASAYFFLMVALLGILWSLESRNRTWLALASLAYGLAIASRPNYVFGAFALAVPLWVGWRQDRGQQPRPTCLLLAAILPITSVITVLLLYNYLRFDSLFEFGPRYMLGAWDQRAMGGLSPAYVIENAWHYLVSPPGFHADFPFVTSPTWLATGVLVGTPFVWMVLLLPLAGHLETCSSKATGPALPAFITILFVVLFANLGILLLLPSGNQEAVLASANSRYIFDFLPVFVLLACLGAMTAGHLAALRLWLRRCLCATTGSLALLSLLAALSFDFQRFPHETYLPLAKVLNLPSYTWDRLRGASYGPVQIELEFPRDRIGQYEPILATGAAEPGNLIYVFYVSSDEVQFGLVGAGIAGLSSKPVKINFSDRHRLEISLGSLYPQVGHPLLRRLSAPQVSFLKRRIRIVLDDQLVLDAPAHFHPSSPNHIRIGETSFLQGYSNARFTGRILATRRPGITTPATIPAPDPVYGPVRMKVRFPANKRKGAEPLLATGLQQAGDVVYVEYASEQRIRLGLDHWGHAGLRTEWLTVDPAVDHTLEIRMGSLYPPAHHVLWSALTPEEMTRLKRRVQMSLDERIVLEANYDAYESAPYDVTVGRNIIGASSCSSVFTGELREIVRLPLPDPAGSAR